MAKGISANMMKNSSKRRRTRKEIQAAKEAEANREADMAAKMAQLAQAQEKLADYNEMQRNYDNAHAVLTQLKEQGIIDVDDHGNISPSKKKPQQQFHDFDEQ